MSQNNGALNIHRRGTDKERNDKSRKPAPRLAGWPVRHPEGKGNGKPQLRHSPRSGRVTGHVRICTATKGSEDGNQNTEETGEASPAGNDARKGVDLTFGSLEESWTKIAQLVTSPALAASRAIQAVEEKGGFGRYLDMPELINCLRDQAAVVNGGDLALTEAMLMNQATTLQSLFSRLIERGMGCDHYPGFEANLKMALRAQSQCRATLETLAAIKNPPVVFARQANVTTGPQQINNGKAVRSRALENESQQTQLLRVDHGQRLDTGTTGAAIGVDTHLATVGEIHRAKVGSR